MMKSADQVKNEVLAFIAELQTKRQDPEKILATVSDSMVVMDNHPFGHLSIKTYNTMTYLPVEVMVEWYSFRKKKSADWSYCVHASYEWSSSETIIEATYDKRQAWINIYPDRCIRYDDLKTIRPYLKKGCVFPQDAQKIHVLAELCGMLLIACDLKCGSQCLATYICTPVGYIWAPLFEAEETFEGTMARVTEWLADIVGEPPVPDLESCQWADIEPIWTMAALAGLLEPDGCL